MKVRERDKQVETRGAARSGGDQRVKVIEERYNLRLEVKGSRGKGV